MLAKRAVQVRAGNHASKDDVLTDLQQPNNEKGLAKGAVTRQGASGRRPAAQPNSNGKRRSVAETGATTSSGSEDEEDDGSAEASDSEDDKIPSHLRARTYVDHPETGKRIWVSYRGIDPGVREGSKEFAKEKRLADNRASAARSRVLGRLRGTTMEKQLKDQQNTINAMQLELENLRAQLVRAQGGVSTKAAVTPSAAPPSASPDMGPARHYPDTIIHTISASSDELSLASDASSTDASTGDVRVQQSARGKARTRHPAGGSASDGSQSSPALAGGSGGTSPAQSCMSLASTADITSTASAGSVIQELLDNGMDELGSDTCDRLVETGGCFELAADALMPFDWFDVPGERGPMNLDMPLLDGVPSPMPAGHGLDPMMEAYSCPRATTTGMMMGVQSNAAATRSSASHYCAGAPPRLPLLPPDNVANGGLRNSSMCYVFAEAGLCSDRVSLPATPTRYVSDSQAQGGFLTSSDLEPALPPLAALSPPTSSTFGGFGALAQRLGLARTATSSPDCDVLPSLHSRAPPSPPALRECGRKRKAMDAGDALSPSAPPVAGPTSPTAAPAVETGKRARRDPVPPQTVGAPLPTPLAVVLGVLCVVFCAISPGHFAGFSGFDDFQNFSTSRFADADADAASSGGMCGDGDLGGECSHPTLQTKSAAQAAAAASSLDDDGDRCPPVFDYPTPLCPYMPALSSRANGPVYTVPATSVVGAVPDIAMSLPHDPSEQSHVFGRRLLEIVPELEASVAREAAAAGSSDWSPAAAGLAGSGPVGDGSRTVAGRFNDSGAQPPSDALVAAVTEKLKALGMGHLLGYAPLAATLVSLAGKSDAGAARGVPQFGLAGQPADTSRTAGATALLSSLANSGSEYLSSEMMIG